MEDSSFKQANLDNLLLDTTILMPAFGVEVNVDTSDNIKQTLESLVHMHKVKIFISDLTPLEGFLKAFRLAEKLSSEDGKKAAKFGFLAVTRDPNISVISHLDENTLSEAYNIRQKHRDPFDCFIFATAKSLDVTFVTEDEYADNYLDKDKLLSWKNLKKKMATNFSPSRSK